MFSDDPRSLRSPAQRVGVKTFKLANVMHAIRLMNISFLILLNIFLYFFQPNDAFVNCQVTRLQVTSRSPVQGVAFIDGSDGSDVIPGVKVVHDGCRRGWWFRSPLEHDGIVDK